MSPAEDLTNVVLDGRYRLTRLLGEGGMGQVYEGIHEALDRKVAVKVLLPRYAFDAKFRERFLREAKAASKVRHPNVVQILDFGDTPGGSVYFSMELLEGRDLAALLRAEGPLPWPRARHILLQALSALAAAHERHIIHRDIKPANFFIEQSSGLHDFVKVLDFGIAKLAADAGAEESSLAQSLTGTGEVFGTAKYMAPEQAYGASNDPRVDVYSLGIVAYELLTGKVPFTGVSAFHIITRHVNDAPQPPRELVPDLPPAVEAWILRALAKHPDDRFASMVEMEQALLAITAGVPTAMPLTHSRPPPSAMSATPPVLASMPAVAPMPASVQARPRPMSDLVTAPALARPVEPAPSAGSGTSVIPTRLKAPSPVTSGELAVGTTGATSRGSEDSGIGSSTSRLQGAGDDASATGPTRSHAAGAVVPETDPHPRYTASRAVVPARKPGFVLGLLGTLGGGLAVLVGYLVVAASDDEPAPAAPVVEASAPQDRGSAASSESGTAVEGPPSAPTSTAAPTTSAATAPTVPASPTAIVAPPVEPTPTEPETTQPATPAPKPTSKPAAPKPAKPLTDTKVASQLARTLAKKCGALADGITATVSVLVSSDGSVLSKSVTGASGELAKCLTTGAAKAQFPPGPQTRRLQVEVSL